MTDAEIKDLLNRLTAKRVRIAQGPPVSSASLNSLWDDYALRQAHETTALEGNTLTLRETQAVLERGVTIPGKSFREHLEVVNAHRTWAWLRPLAERGEQLLTETLVLEMHRRLMQGILEDEAGFYRRTAVYIRGSFHVPPNWVKVPDLMAAWTARYAAGPGTEHPVRWVAQAHIDLVQIHPFLDGNGRTTRMVVNLLLGREGYPPALYSAAERQTYLQALEMADRGDARPFIAVTARAVEWTQDRWLGLLPPQREAGRATRHPRQPPPPEWDR